MCLMRWRSVFSFQSLLHWAELSNILHKFCHSSSPFNVRHFIFRWSSFCSSVNCTSRIILQIHEIALSHIQNRNLKPLHHKAKQTKYNFTFPKILMTIRSPFRNCIYRPSELQKVEVQPPTCHFPRREWCSPRWLRISRIHYIII